MAKQLFFIVVLLVGMVAVQGCSSSSPTQPEPPEQPMPEPQPDPEPDALSDEELLDTVQRQTFKYFWEGAEPNSGLAFERSSSSTTVTMGGSGFGLAAYPAAVERGWVSRDEAITRVEKVLDFLEQVPTYHGAFSHWYNGQTAQTIPFSTLDDGGDIVETAFLMEGLLILRQYFDGASPQEEAIRSRITALWENVEWSWYQQQGENTITWHWSPDNGFEIDLQVGGWNEALMVYVLAAASPTHPIEPEVYRQGWAGNGRMQNGNTFYGEQLPLGPDRGGPLFFAHYSFIGLNPRGLTDQYANYERQNTAHTLINYNYCVANPLGYQGYGENMWGLTASDEPDGYGVHSPDRDNGVITPTAAISSIVYTPENSLRAMRYFYEEFNNRLWGEYGFRDAFSLQEGWFADDYLAIDQGPIVGMIENHRTGLLWNLFMADDDVQNGLQTLGFSSPTF